MKVSTQNHSRSYLGNCFSKRVLAANAAVVSGVALISIGYITIGASIIGSVVMSTSLYFYFKPTALDKKINVFVSTLIIAMEYRLEAHGIKAALAVTSVSKIKYPYADIDWSLRKLKEYERGLELSLQALENLKNELINEARDEIINKLKIKLIVSEDLAKNIELIIILAITLVDYDGTILDKNKVKNLIKKFIKEYPSGQFNLKAKDLKSAFKLTDTDIDGIFKTLSKTRSFGSLNLLETVLKKITPIRDTGAGVGVS